MQPKRTPRTDRPAPGPDRAAPRRASAAPRQERVVPRSSASARRASQWTTDAKISAGVLGALAALCAGVVGYRVIESRYFAAAPVASTPEVSAVDPANARPADPIGASSDLDRGGSASIALESESLSRPPQALTSQQVAAPLPRGASAIGAEEADLSVGDPQSVAETQATSLPPARFMEDDAAFDASFSPAAEGMRSPPASGPSLVEILPDDSFWLISQRAYGTGAYYKALYRFHEAAIPEPDRLPAGEAIEIPPVETLRELFPEDVPATQGGSDVATLKTYRTKRGDTALSVAQAQLGDESRWTEVFWLNQRAVTSPDAPLPEDYELKLPSPSRTASAPAERAASSPQSSAAPLR